MAALGEDEWGKRCVAAAFVLCIVHTLTIIGTEYQVWAAARIDWSQTDNFFDGLLAILVNGGIYLSPIIVLLFVRSICALVGILAVPILIFFTFRLHHVWQFYWLGINSMAQQKGDELGWFTLIFEMISGLVAVPLLLGFVVIKLVQGARRAWQSWSISIP